MKADNALAGAGPIMLPAKIKLFGLYSITVKMTGLDRPITHVYFLKDITENHLYVFDHEEFKTLTYTAQEVLEKLRDGTLKWVKGGIAP